jgi:hypothetical protein
MKILLGDFNAKEGREDIFTRTIGIQCLHDISNDNGVRVVNFVTPKILLSKLRCSHIVTLINLFRYLLMERQQNLPHFDWWKTASKYTWCPKLFNGSPLWTQKELGAACGNNPLTPSYRLSLTSSIDTLYRPPVKVYNTVNNSATLL